MKPIRTDATPDTMGGGRRHTGADDLPVRMIGHAGSAGIVERGHPGYHLPCIVSVWSLDPSERVGVAGGAQVELIVWGERQPPINLGVTRDTIEPGIVPGPTLWLEVELALAQDLAKLLDRDDPSGLSPASRARLGEMREFLRLGIAELEQREEAPG